MMNTLPDTRPYPTDPIKNELLLYAEQIATSKHTAQHKLASENLQIKIAQMLEQHHFLGLSVAMSMAANSQVYTILLNHLTEVLNANNQEQIQWFALPIILVTGSPQELKLPSHTPINELKNVLQQNPDLLPLTQAQWLPYLITANQLANIKVDSWYHAKQSLANAQQFAKNIPEHPFIIPSNQSVHILYALGYGQQNIQISLGKNLQQTALPLMQIWQQHLAHPQLTLFANPLNPNHPILAMNEATHMRLRMALDVFSANAIRSIRLHNAKVGVVMAAQQSGQLLFGFSGTHHQNNLSNQVFTWPLSPKDNIAIIQQNFLDLMTDCQVEHIRLLHEPLAENATLPTYAEAQTLAGHNPLLSPNS